MLGGRSAGPAARSGRRGDGRHLGEGFVGQHSRTVAANFDRFPLASVPHSKAAPMSNHASNGDPTQAPALLDGSAAFDSGDPAFAG